MVYGWDLIPQPLAHTTRILPIKLLDKLPELELNMITDDTKVRVGETMMIKLEVLLLIATSNHQKELHLTSSIKAHHFKSRK